MPFWNKGNSDDEKKRKEREQATLAALANGEVPPSARERIERQKHIGAKFFTSDLTSREYMLCREAKFETVGQVMGTAFFNVSFFGFYSGRYQSTGELASITHAQQEARRMAVSRMKHEAELMGAHGVIGVRITLRSHEWSSRLTEFTAVGTAIRLPNWDDSLPTFTSDLNGQEFWQLYRAGMRPTGLVFGVCCYYMYTDWSTQNIVGRRNWLLQTVPNQEVNLYTQGVYTARDLAESRMILDATNHGADGVVGMKIDNHLEDIEYEVNDVTYHDLLAHFVCLGTGVKEDPRLLQAAPTPKPLLMYNLSTGKTSSVEIQQSNGYATGGFGDIDEDDDDDFDE